MSAEAARHILHSIYEVEREERIAICGKQSRLDICIEPAFTISQHVA